MRILRATDRYETVQPGIVTRHCFAAGSHYDPDNLAFEPLIGLDEHVVAPGAGFAEHAHRGVKIISWVAAGTLEHSTGGTTQLVHAGESLVQDATETIRHTERNASDTEPLRLIQTTLLAEAGVTMSVVSESEEFYEPWLHLFVVGGRWGVNDETLHPGDSARISDESVRLNGSGILLALR